MHPFIRLVMLAFIVALSLPVATSAQTSVGTPEPPPGAEETCTITPRTIEEIEALIADVEPLPDDAPGFDVIDALPTGTPADEATTAEIAAALDHYLLCIFTEPDLTTVGFWSDSYIRDQAAHIPDLLDLFTTPVEIFEDAPIGTLDTIDHVTVLGDGRVSAVVTTDGFEDDAPIEDRTTLVILVREDGVWKLDGGYDRVTSGPGGSEESIVDALARETAATPVATPEASPAAAGCDVEPRTIEEIEALVADVEPLPAGSSSLDIIDAIPTGTLANAATIAEIAATLDMFFVCAASGRLLTVAGFWSDDLIREQVAHVPEFLNFLVSPIEDGGLDDPGRSVATIDHVTVLGDGRVSAVVTFDGFEDDAPIEERTDLVILMREDGVWKLDGAYSQVRPGPGETGPISISDVLPPSTPAGTPSG